MAELPPGFIFRIYIYLWKRSACRDDGAYTEEVGGVCAEEMLVSSPTLHQLARGRRFRRTFTKKTKESGQLAQVRRVFFLLLLISPRGRLCFAKVHTTKENCFDDWRRKTKIPKFSSGGRHSADVWTNWVWGVRAINYWRMHALMPSSFFFSPTAVPCPTLSLTTHFPSRPRDAFIWPAEERTCYISVTMRRGGKKSCNWIARPQLPIVFFILIFQSISGGKKKKPGAFIRPNTRVRKYDIRETDVTTSSKVRHCCPVAYYYSPSGRRAKRIVWKRVLPQSSKLQST